MNNTLIVVICVTVLSAYGAYLGVEGASDLLMLTAGGLIGHLGK